jgi:1-acyl-sn-glycerol-3-phosphate acyltransferase
LSKHLDMKKKIYKFILYQLMGWKINGSIKNAEIKKCVFIVVPHTSWHDFYLGLLIRGIIDFEINFVGKKELFVFPFGFYFKWLGGAPLNRFQNENKVDAIAKIFDNKEIFRLAIAPEGTRKKVYKWRSGFYHIAMKARVPIIPIAFDFKTKEIRFFDPFYPTGNYEADVKILEQNYKGIQGKIKEYTYIVK